MELKKKVAFLLFSLEGGGEERIASILAGQISKECELYIVLFNLPIDYDLPKETRINILRPIYQNRLLRLLTLPLLPIRYFFFCKKQGITISLSFDNLANFVNCCLKLLGWKGKVNLREVNYVSVRFPTYTLYGRAYRFLIKNLYPKADKLYMNTQRIADDLQENFSIQIPMELMLNPLDFKLIARQKSILIPAPKKFTFIHVGGFRPQKNHHLLIDAFAKIQQLDVQLWLLGKGTLEQEIKDKVNKLGLNHQIHFLGFQRNPFKYMAAADCMVLSSNFEGLPNVLLEGLACDLPIISTDCFSGPREVIAPNLRSAHLLKKDLMIVSYGILTPTGDAFLLGKAMEEVYHNPSIRKSKKYSKRARRFLDKNRIPFL